MQDLRQTPPLIFEYAIFPNGDQHFTYVGDSAGLVLGVSQSELRRDHSLLYSNIYTEDAVTLRQAIEQRQRQPVPQVLTVRMNQRSETTWREVAFSDDVTSDGHLIRRGVIRPIEMPGDARFAQSSRNEELLENLPIGVVIHHQGIVLYANKHAHLVIGATRPGQLTGLKAFDFVHPDYLSDISERIKRVAEGDAVPMVEQKFVCMDGKVIDVETMAFPFSYKGKSAVQVIFRDITEKKKIEAEVRRNETLLTQLFQHLPMAVVMLDDSGRVAEVNRGFEEMFGYSKEELHGKNLNDFIVPEDLQGEGIHLNNFITSNRVVSKESIRKHRSGKLIHVILYGVPVIFDDRAIGIYGVYVDISDRKKVEEELKIRNTELDNFVYKVSHDLRAPLSSVLGLVNLSRLQGNTDNPLEYIDIIGQKIHALDNFIGDVLSHAKNLKIAVDICKVDLRAIIEQSFTNLGYLQGAQQTKRLVKIDGVDFYSDPWRLSEIFRNLISNAIKYRKPDSNESEIIVKIHVDHLCADISFADNGIGINESSLKRIFEMFYRATEQSEGSGIGLYIVKNAVEKLGGQIKVASAPGEGTRFHMLIPNCINSLTGTPANPAETR